MIRKTGESGDWPPTPATARLPSSFLVRNPHTTLSPLHVNRAQTPDAEKGGVPGPWPRGLLRISYAAWRSTPGPWAPGFILRQCLVFGLFSAVGKDPLYLALIPSVWNGCSPSPGTRSQGLSGCWYRDFSL